MVDSSRGRVSGSLTPFSDGFVVALTAVGYTPHAVVKQLRLFARLSQWLQNEDIVLADLDREVVERFFSDRRAAGYTELVSARAAEPLLAYLRGIGVVPPEVAPAPCGPVEELLASYRRYLVLERGLLAESAKDDANSVRPFLEGLAGESGLDLAGLDGAAVVAFVVARCPSQSRSSAKRTVKALRSLLRFLHVEGHVGRSLAHAVPSVGGWRLSSLPKRLEPEEVRRLLASCDQRTAAGRRDFAVLTVLARLGLRASEIVVLSLDDVDWRAGEVVVHGKHNRSDRLPLPADVGEAIVAWLRHGRPGSALGRTVFVRVRAPHRALSRAGVSKIVSDAGARAGLGTLGAHQLRHTLASEMLKAGASLPEIGQVLRHSHPDTTAIYAKVDRDALRGIARGWPEALR